MRGEDYRRLARLSLKAKRKTTIQTVVGISFGLILLFPLLFIAIGFYGGFNKEINDDPNCRVLRVNYANLKTVSGDVLCSEEYEKKIDKIPGIKNSLKYDYVYINNIKGRTASFSINDGEIQEVLKPENVYSRNKYLGIQIIDQECAHTPFISADYEHAVSPLVAGKTFSKDNSCGEIMVSTKFTYDYQLEPEEIIGSTISLYNHVAPSCDYYSSSKEEIIKPNEYKEDVIIPYFKNYKIVGVYSSNIYNFQSPRYFSIMYDPLNYTTRKRYSKDYFWISSASLGEGGVASMPERIARQTKVNDELVNESWFYYEDKPAVLAEKVTDAGYAFIPKGLGVFSRASFIPTYTKSQLIEFHSFQYSKGAYDDIDECYRRSVTGDPDNIIYKYDTNIAPKWFFVYQEFYDRFLFLCLAFGVFGGVIFVATLLNLINTLHYSVESSRGFLGICRAQGLKRREVTRLFFNQIMIIFMRGYISTIIVGGGACVLIKYLFDKSLKDQIMEDSTMNLTLQWWYIPIALGILLVLTTVLAVVISHLLVRRTNKTPVLEILSEENKM